MRRSVAAALQWPLVDKDDARDAFAPLNAAGVALSMLNSVSYDVMWRVCGRQLSIGLPGVVVDCPLARLELYQQAASLAGQHNAVIAVVECVPQDEVLWRQRLEARAQQHGVGSSNQGHKPQTWEQLQQLISG